MRYSLSHEDLPPRTLNAFVDAWGGARGYGSASEYVRDLIRLDADIQRFRALVEDGLGSGPAVEADDAFFEELRAEIRSRAAE